MTEDFELILAREAQLMYERAKGFTPFKGDLTIWRGEIAGRGEYRGLKFEVEVKIPPTFPFDPPIIRMISPTDHPNVDPETGRVHLSILDQWKPEYHVYHAINTLKGVFAKVPPRPLFKKPQKTPIPSLSESGAEVPPSEFLDRIAALERQVKELQRKLQEKDETIASLRSRLTTHAEVAIGTVQTSMKVPVDEKLELESEKIAIEDLIRSLEEKFEAGEIDPTDYTRLYRKYKKQWYIVNKKLQSLRGEVESS
ncbi:MAG: ubiquitin-conjugating enzyme E2 [Candidatus Freyarchaeota archaeon]|nr:ubiquitin-conjugating enzyme E2 [Candidatus Freyrarchaeum guaymaensis]HDO81018.1 hypothetical protein [Candidatus Bathyarchaeota archaeon]